MQIKKTVLYVVLVVSVLLTTMQSCGTSSMLGSGSGLLSSLAGNSNLSSFAGLLQTPGLEKLVGPALKGKFTMLAPSNAALGTLGADALGSLSKPENLNLLAGILKNHIVPGKLDASSLLKGGLKTAGGKDLSLGGVNLGDVISDKKFNIIPIDKILQ